MKRFWCKIPSLDASFALQIIQQTKIVSEKNVVFVHLLVVIIESLFFFCARYNQLAAEKEDDEEEGQNTIHESCESKYSQNVKTKLCFLCRDQ